MSSDFNRFQDNYGFINKIEDNINAFYSKAIIPMMGVQKKYMGTNVEVRRVRPGSNKYGEVFGKLYNSTLDDDEDVDIFSTNLLLDKNYMVDEFQQMSMPLQVQDVNNVLELGDIVSYMRKGKVYRFRVTEKQAFSDAVEVLQQYTLTPLIDTV